MRITTGKFKGRPIAAPAGMDIRPTSDRARQAIFNILQHGKPAQALGAPIPQGLQVLDVFCGTGALGLEALSRGAVRAGFIDQDVRCARNNAVAMNASDHCEFFSTDAAILPPAKQSYDLVFMDPPYKSGLAQRTVPELQAKGWLADGAILAIETSRDESLDLPQLELLDERIYGAAKVGFYRLLAAE